MMMTMMMVVIVKSDTEDVNSDSSDSNESWIVCIAYYTIEKQDRIQ